MMANLTHKAFSKTSPEANGIEIISAKIPSRCLLV